MSKRFIYRLMTGAALGAVFFVAFHAVQAQSIDFPTNFAGFSTADIKVVIENIVRIVIGFIGIIFVLLLIAGGIMWMTSGGSADRINQAKKLIAAAVIGLIITLSAYAIAGFIITSVQTVFNGGSNNSGGGGGGLPGCTDPGSGIVKICSLSGGATPGSVIGINGYNFGFPQGSGTVVFEAGGVPTTAQIVSCNATSSWGAQHIDAIVPPTLTAGILYNVIVTNPTNIACTVGTTCKTHTLIAGTSPSIFCMNPTTGLANGTQSVALTGAYFGSAPGAIKMDGASGQFSIPAAAITSWSTTDIVFKVPDPVAALAAISGNVFVVDSGSLVSNGEWYTVTCGNNNQCSSNCCSSGACQAAAVCTAGGPGNPQGPVITSVLPPDGAIGTYATIWGNNFGATKAALNGVLTIKDSAGATITDPLAAAAACVANNWSDTQIIMQIPPGTANGVWSVQVTTNVAGSNTDKTFTVNATVRPGLCSVAPATGPFNQSFVLSGNNFTAAAHDIYFGIKPSNISANNPIVSNPTTASATVPNIVPSVNSVAMCVGATLAACVDSNPLQFIVTGTSGSAPLITDVSPHTGPVGQYVTVIGNNFGTTSGKVEFIENKVAGAAFLADTVFPAACSTTYWANDHIVVKVPNAIAMADGDYYMVVTTSTNQKSQTSYIATVNDFKKDSSLPLTPGLCNINPIGGPAATPVDYNGEGFGSTTGKVFFYNNQQSSALASWANQQVLKALVPGAAVTGLTYVQSSLGTKSNGLPFNVGSCTSDPQCGLGNICCTGICRVNGPSGCGTTNTDENAWAFTSGQYPFDITDSISCGASIQTPTPYPYDQHIPAASPTYNANNIQTNAPVDSVIAATFTRNLNFATIAPNVKIFQCNQDVSGTGWGGTGSCTTDVTLNGTFSPVSSVGFQWKLATGSLFLDATWYEVRLDNAGAANSKVQATDGSLYQGSVFLGAGVNSFRWHFRTRTASQARCDISDVRLNTPNNSPSQPLPNVLAPIGADSPLVTATPLNAQCYICGGAYTYQWDYAPRPPSPNQYADFSPVPAPTIDTTTLFGVNITPDVQTPPGTAPTLTATVTNPPTGGPITSSIPANLTVDYLAPSVVKYSPNNQCQNVCTNALAYADFNVPLDPASLGGNVELHTCATTSCVPLGPLVNSTAAVDPSISTRINVTPNLPSPNLLQPNTIYAVVLKAGIKNTQGQSMDPAYLNYGSPKNAFYWYFTTNQGSCNPTALIVHPTTPPPVVVNSIGVNTNFSGELQAVDPACGTVSINPQPYSWTWGSSAPAVAAVNAPVNGVGVSGVTVATQSQGSTNISASIASPFLAGASTLQVNDTRTPINFNGFRPDDPPGGTPPPEPSPTNGICDLGDLNPAHCALNCTNVLVSAFFTASVNASSVNSSNFVVKDALNNVVQGTYNVLNYTISGVPQSRVDFTPTTGAYLPTAPYSVFLCEGGLAGPCGSTPITSTQGLPYSLEQKWSFTTGPALCSISFLDIVPSPTVFADRTLECYAGTPQCTDPAGSSAGQNFGAVAKDSNGLDLSGVAYTWRETSVYGGTFTTPYYELDQTNGTDARVAHKGKLGVDFSQVTAQSANPAVPLGSATAQGELDFSFCENPWYGQVTSGIPDQFYLDPAYDIQLSYCRDSAGTNKSDPLTILPDLPSPHIIRDSGVFSSGGDLLKEHIFVVGSTANGNSILTNGAPYFTATPAVQPKYRLGDVVYFQLYAKDDEGDGFQFVKNDEPGDPLPASASFNARTGTFIWTVDQLPNDDDNADGIKDFTVDFTLNPVNNTASGTRTVTINVDTSVGQQPLPKPIVTLVSPSQGTTQTITYGGTVTFNATLSKCSNGANPPCSIKSFIWDFQDSGLTSYTSTVDPYSANHIFIQSGLHEITFRVQDSTGAWSDPATTYVIVLPKVVLHSPATADGANDLFRQALATGRSLAASIDDRLGHMGTRLAELVGKGLSLVTNHVYGAANLPPSLTCTTCPTAVNQNGSNNWTLTATDPNGDPVQYYAKWGDGSFSPLTAPLPSGTPFTFSHVYTKTGSQNAEFSAWDPSYAVNTSAKTIAVAVVAPAAPSGLTAKVISNASVNLQWTDNANNETASYLEVGNYPVCTSWVTAGQLPSGLPQNSTATTVGGWVPSSTLCLRVYATNSAGNSAYSNVVTVPLVPSGPPNNAPGSPSITTPTGTLYSGTSYTWTVSATDIDPGDTAALKYSANWGDGSFTAGQLSGSLSHTYSSTYTIYPQPSFVATDPGGLQQAQGAPFSTINTLSLLAPTALAATPISATQVNLSWTASSNNNEEYTWIERSANGSTGWGQIAFVPHAVTAYSDKSALSGANYYRVRISNVALFSPYSTVANAVTSAGPPTITLINGNTQLLSNVAKNWQFWASDPNPGTTLNYTVNWGDGSPQTSGSASVATFSGAGVVVSHSVNNPGTTILGPYSPWFKVTNATTGLSDTKFYTNYNPPTTQTVYTVFASQPLTPTSFTATPQSSSVVRLNWTNPAGSSATIINIDSYTAPAASYSFLTALPPNATTYDNTGLTGGKTYNYRIYGSNGNANPPDSAYAFKSATTPAANVAPTVTSIVGPAALNQTLADQWTLKASDPEGTAMTYDVDWGDGTAHATGSASNLTLSGAGVPLTHAYITIGTYTITAKVTDGGAPPLTSPSLTTTVTIVGPIVTNSISGSASPTVNISSSWTVKAHDPVSTSNVLNYVINWGDGSSATAGSATDAVLNGSGVAAPHTYASTGSYTISAYVWKFTYSGTTSSPTITKPVTAVGNTAPTISSITQSLSNPIVSGTAGQWTIVASDPDVGDTLTYSVPAWGDGGSSIGGPSPLFGYTYTNTTAATVNYTATFTAKDLAGATATKTLVVPVLPKPPGVVTGLTATGFSSSQINLAWTNPVGSTAATIQIDSASAAGGPWTSLASLPGTATSYSHTGLPANTTVFYRLQGTNPGGISAYVTANAKTLVNNAPVVNSITGSSPVTVATSNTWTLKAHDSDGNDMNYDVDWGDGSAHWTGTATDAVLNGAGVTQTHTYGTTVGSPFTITAFVKDIPGNLQSPNKTTSVSVVNVNVPPVISNVNGPTSFPSGATPSSWTINATDPGDTITYSVVAWGDGTSAVGQASATFNHSYPAQTAATYNATFKATDSGGLSTTFPLTITVALNPVITSFTGPVPAALAIGQVGTWTLKATDPSTGTSMNYTVNWNDPAVADTAGTATNAQLLTGITITKTYPVGSVTGTKNVKVTVQNAGFSANQTVPFTLGASLLPAVPTGVSATTISTSQIRVDWTDVSSNELGFNIDYSTDNTFATFLSSAATSANTNTITINGLLANTTYYFRVQSYNAAGNSPWSPTVNATTAPIPVNNAPTISSVTAPSSLTAGQIGTWKINATDIDVGDVLSYSVVWGDGQSAAAQSAPRFTHAYTAAGSYPAVFKVTDQGGLSATSALTVVVTATQPPAVTSFATPATTLAVNYVYWWTLQATDPQGYPMTYTIDWGDGTTSSVQSFPAATPTSAQVTHAYTTIGNYTPKAVVANSVGLSASLLSSIVTVSNSASIIVSNSSSVPPPTNLKADSVGSPLANVLTWVNGAAYDSINIYISEPGLPVVTVSPVLVGTAGTYSHTPVTVGTSYSYKVCGVINTVEGCATVQWTTRNVDYDIIDMRIYKNPNYLNVSEWYKRYAPNPSGTPKDIVVDGYDAIQDGTSVYVGMGNCTNPASGTCGPVPLPLGQVSVYGNILLLSFNASAKPPTIAIFNQLVANLKINQSLTTTDSGSTSSFCSGDASLACEPGHDAVCQAKKAGLCMSAKSELRRDYSREVDLHSLVSSLTSYSQGNLYCDDGTNTIACKKDADCPSGNRCTGVYPSLSAGTYLPGISTSKWPSWDATLGKALQSTALPHDPIDQFGNSFYSTPHPTCADIPGADPSTCWNEKQSQFICYAGSEVYMYQIKNGTNFKAYGLAEAPGWSWSNQSSNVILNDPGYGGVCKNTTAATGVCGNGIIESGEKCDGGSVNYCDNRLGAGNWNNEFKVGCKSDCSAWGDPYNGNLAAATAACGGACGDGTINAPIEQCDPKATPNGTQGFNCTNGGSIFCSNTCQISCTAGSPYGGICGDGIITPPEVCDPSIPGAACNSTCTGFTNFCGDGKLTDFIQTPPICTCDTQIYYGAPSTGIGIVGAPCTKSCGAGIGAHLETVATNPEECDNILGLTSYSCANNRSIYCDSSCKRACTDTETVIATGNRLATSLPVYETYYSQGQTEDYSYTVSSLPDYQYSSKGIAFYTTTYPGNGCVPDVYGRATVPVIRYTYKGTLPIVDSYLSTAGAIKYGASTDFNTVSLFCAYAASQPGKCRGNTALTCTTDTDCSSQGPCDNSVVPVYEFLTTKTSGDKDYYYSRRSIPRTDNQGKPYVIQNNGNPVFYVQTGPFQETCGNGVLEGTEVCESSIYQTPSPAQSNATNQYACGAALTPNACQVYGGFCGNGATDKPFEQCDEGVPAQSTCSGNSNTPCTSDYDCPTGQNCLGNGATCNNNAANCTFCSNSCSLQLVPKNFCGDGIVNCGVLTPKICGDADAGTEVCDDGTKKNGTVGNCNATCSGITGSVCGNGIIEGFCANTTPVSCSSSIPCPSGQTCTSNVCANTTPIACGTKACPAGQSCTIGEKCDDGPKNGTWALTCSSNAGIKCSGKCSGNSAACTSNSQCPGTETCDADVVCTNAGAGTCSGAPAAYCSTSCLGPTVGFCGDGFIQSPNSSGTNEVCDAGSKNGTPNNCNATCTALTPAVCGDNVISPGICSLDNATSCSSDADCAPSATKGVCLNAEQCDPAATATVSNCTDITVSPPLGQPGLQQVGCSATCQSLNTSCNAFGLKVWSDGADVAYFNETAPAAGVFGTVGAGGVVNFTNSNSTALMAKDIQIDGNDMYIAGWGSNDTWHIEKRSISTGALNSSFGTNGVIDLGVAGQEARSIAIDTATTPHGLIIGGEISIGVGSRNQGDFRAERRNAVTGALCDGSVASGCGSTAFGTAGVQVFQNKSRGAYKVLLDGIDYFIAGVGRYDINGTGNNNDEWYIEKLNKDTSAAVNAFSGNGVFETFNSGNSQLNSIAIGPNDPSGKTLFAGGSDTGTPDDKSVAIDKTTGAKNSALSYSSPSETKATAASVKAVYKVGWYAGNWFVDTLTASGLVQTLLTPSTPTGIAEAVALDPSQTHVYVFGESGSGWKVGRYVIQVNGSLVVDGAFGTAGFISSASTTNLAGAIAVDANDFYLVGNDDSNHIVIEKHKVSDGSLDNSINTIFPTKLATLNAGGACVTDPNRQNVDYTNPFSPNSVPKNTCAAPSTSVHDQSWDATVVAADVRPVGSPGGTPTAAQQEVNGTNIIGVKVFLPAGSSAPRSFQAVYTSPTTNTIFYTKPGSTDWVCSNIYTPGWYGSACGANCDPATNANWASPSSYTNSSRSQDALCKNPYTNNVGADAAWIWGPGCDTSGLPAPDNQPIVYCRLSFDIDLGGGPTYGTNQYCGDGTVNGPESCDKGALGNGPCPSTCNAQCGINNCSGGGGGGGGTGGSFAAGTMVLTPSAPRTIDQLQIGDDVVSYDEALGATIVEKVEERRVRPDARDYYLINGTVKVTAEHPLAVVEHSTLTWKKARELQVNDILMSYAGNHEQIMSIKHVFTTFNMSVYNPQIAGTHTYFVIMHGVPVIVHNKAKIIP